MYVTFKNNSASAKMFVALQGQKYIIPPQTVVEVFVQSENFQFLAETSAMDELIDAVNEINDNDKNDSLKDRILTKFAKFAKKAAQKLPDTVLITSVKYEIKGADCSNIVVNLNDGVRAVCSGSLADLLDLVPLIYVFPRAETESGSIRIADVNITNRKKFLKLVRNLLLFMHSGLTAINLLFFIPEYLLVKLLSSKFYIKAWLSGLYRKTFDKRELILKKAEERYERNEKKLFSPALKAFIIIAVVCGVLVWGITSEPDVVVSEDFQSVVCFEETFVKIGSGLPSDAEEVFLEDYSAFYPLADGEYDMDNYYCYIYETPDGTRYMWLKDNCSNKENDNKNYEDYENPLVYKSIGKVISE